MKQYLFCLFLAAYGSTVGHGFVVSSPRPCRQAQCLQLTPDQAPDLEACAYDLMKAALMAKAAQEAALAAEQEAATKYLSYHHHQPQHFHVMDNAITKRMARVPVWCKSVWRSITHHNNAHHQRD